MSQFLTSMYEGSFAIADTLFKTVCPCLPIVPPSSEESVAPIQLPHPPNFKKRIYCQSQRKLYHSSKSDNGCIHWKKDGIQFPMQREPKQQRQNVHLDVTYPGRFSPCTANKKYSNRDRKECQATKQRILKKCLKVSNKNNVELLKLVRFKQPPSLLLHPLRLSLVEMNIDKNRKFIMQPVIDVDDTESEHSIGVASDSSFSTICDYNASEITVTTIDNQTFKKALYDHECEMKRKTIICKRLQQSMIPDKQMKKGVSLECEKVLVCEKDMSTQSLSESSIGNEIEAKAVGDSIDVIEDTGHTSIPTKVVPMVEQTERVSEALKEEKVETAMNDKIEGEVEIGEPRLGSAEVMKSEESYKAGDSMELSDAYKSDELTTVPLTDVLVKEDSKTKCNAESSGASSTSNSGKKERMCVPESSSVHSSRNSTMDVNRIFYKSSRTNSKGGVINMDTIIDPGFSVPLNILVEDSGGFMM